MLDLIVLVPDHCLSFYFEFFPVAKLRRQVFSCLRSSVFSSGGSRGGVVREEARRSFDFTPLWSGIRFS